MYTHMRPLCHCHITEMQQKSQINLQKAFKKLSKPKNDYDQHFMLELIFKKNKKKTAK